jgi:hypothetical protein
MTTDREMEDVVVTSAEQGEFAELGEVSVETKGGGGFYIYDGGLGYYI